MRTIRCLVGARRCAPQRGLFYSAAGHSRAQGRAPARLPAVTRGAPSESEGLKGGGRREAPGAPPQ